MISQLNSSSEHASLTESRHEATEMLTRCERRKHWLSITIWVITIAAGITVFIARSNGLLQDHFLTSLLLTLSVATICMVIMSFWVAAGAALITLFTIYPIWWLIGPFEVLFTPPDKIFFLLVLSAMLVCGVSFIALEKLFLRFIDTPFRQANERLARLADLGSHLPADRVH